MTGFLAEPLCPRAEGPEHPFEPGELLEGRFRIVREVAQGGMGVVYEAFDERLGRRIALKCAKTGFGKRLPPEVRNASEISHPNVCKIHEIHTASTQQGEIDFLTMEFLDGETLGERLKRSPMPAEEARDIARQLRAGLAEAHRMQVIHGDLKSGNVIVTKGAGGTIRAVITDFGLARKPESTQRALASGVQGGTPDYMAPELWMGEKATVASDIYALGVILRELAPGDRVIRGVVTRCLEEEPARRFADADEIARRLAPLTRRRVLAAALVAIMAAISGVVTYNVATAPPETVRLAVLPFASDAGALKGIESQAAKRISRLVGGPNNKFSVIPPKASNLAPTRCRWRSRRTRRNNCCSARESSTCGTGST